MFVVQRRSDGKFWRNTGGHGFCTRGEKSWVSDLQDVKPFRSITAILHSFNAKNIYWGQGWTGPNGQVGRPSTYVDKCCSQVKWSSRGGMKNQCQHYKAAVAERFQKFKSKFTPALTLHVTVYALTMFLVFLFYLDPIWAFGAFLYTWWSHFLTDAVTSRITSRLWFIDLPKLDADGYGAGIVQMKPTRHWFFVVIGLDQLIHYVTLALTFNFIHSLP